MPSRTALALLAGVVVTLLTAGLLSAASIRQAPGAAPPAGPPETVLRPDQARVEGVAATVHLAGAVAQPVPLPVTISIPNRGQGEMTIDGVLSGGKPASVAWDGGQPLPLSGTGAIDLGPATLDVDATGSTWYLDGMPRYLTPGQYAAGSAVAVGNAGVDSATFTVAAGAEARVETVGGAHFHLPPRSLSFTGPGNMTLTGDLSLTTSAGVVVVRRVTFGPGPFELTLTPVAGGYRVDALLQGAHTES